MVKYRLWISVGIVIALFVGVQAATDFSKEQNGLLRHVVCFKFKDDASQEQIDKVVEAFAALKEKIPFIVSFEYGTNVSPENHANGFTHCFVATFKSAKDRDAYLPHPAHKAFGKVLGPILDKVFVIDYWTK